jgi:RNA polymerase sigma-70 factor (ECF subfamily)
MVLTRNPAAADDLVQETALKALRACDSFSMGTNFYAWIHRIMYHQFVSELRSKRPHVDFDDLPEMGVRASQQDTIDIRELGEGMSRLPKDQLEAITMVVLQDRDYEEVSGTMGCAIGTLKSRVHRGRLALRAHMNGESVQLAA